MTVSLWALGALWACVGPPLPVTETGNPERNLGVATFTAVELPDPDAPQVASAWVGLGETKLILDERYAGEHELEWETPEVVADLAQGPASLRFRSPNAGYNRVEIRPRDGRDGPQQAPPELEDASFVVEGTRADGVPFVLISPTEEEIVLAGGFELVQEQKLLALGFDTDAWFEGLDLDGAELQPDGSIRIDTSSNRDLLEIFEANLPGSVTLVEDEDGDGRVGADEPRLTGR